MASSGSAPIQEIARPGTPATACASKFTVVSGGAGSELAAGSLTNFWKGSPTNTAGTLTASRLCRYAGTRASMLRRKAACTAAALGFPPDAVCCSAVTRCRISGGHETDCSAMAATVFCSVGSVAELRGQPRHIQQHRQITRLPVEHLREELLRVGIARSPPPAARFPAPERTSPSGSPHPARPRAADAQSPAGSRPRLLSIKPSSASMRLLSGARAPGLLDICVSRIEFLLPHSQQTQIGPRRRFARTRFEWPK